MVPNINMEWQTPSTYANLITMHNAKHYYRPFLVVAGRTELLDFAAAEENNCYMIEARKGRELLIFLV
jgi:hypothetical protein